MKCSVAQPRDSCAEVSLGCVPEFADERMALQGLLHDAALHACAASVDQTDLAKAGLVCGGDVLFDDGGDIARGKGVEIQCAFNRDAMRHQRTMSLCKWQ